MDPYMNRIQIQAAGVQKCVSVVRFMHRGSKSVQLSSDSGRAGPQVCDCCQIHVSLYYKW